MRKWQKTSHSMSRKCERVIRSPMMQSDGKNGLNRKAWCEMVRYIDADALGIGKAKREAFNDPTYADGWNSAIEIIQNAPTIEARPVVRGGWEDRYTPNGKYVSWDGFYCSVCGKQATKSNFCPNCGADMRGTKDDARS